MFYYKIIGENITKYEVTINRDSLIEIETELNEYFTEWVHVKTKDAKESLQGKKVRNLKEKFRYRETSNGVVKDIYDLEYDYLRSPHLCTLIEALLNNDTSVINEIEKKNQAKTKREELEEQINSFIPITPDKNFDYLTALIKEYKEHCELNASLDRRRRPSNKLSDYYEKVGYCYLSKTISTMPISDFEDIVRFISENDISAITKLVEEKKMEASKMGTNKQISLKKVFPHDY